ncbi:MAG TPA: GNVR domain-containing protein [Acidobacteriaceae bacterium]|nr:GNVR domain-containing protein [Acidobacteriaceae bacterium]
MESSITETEQAVTHAAWSENVLHLWQRRRLLLRVGIYAVVLSGLIAFLVPKRYESSTSIMPPEQPLSGGAMLSAIAARSGSEGAGLASLASGLMGGMGVRNNGDLFMELMRSGEVEGRIAQRFELQHLYRKRYMVDTLKKLRRRTAIVEDKKSGVITITVSDTDRGRAQQMARAYVDELNRLLVQVSTSAARRERMFIESRLDNVSLKLNTAENELSQFSSRTSTVDIKEQTHAMVDAGERMQAQWIVAQADLESLRQIYGDQNLRVKAAQEKVGILQRQLSRMGGGETASGQPGAKTGEMYPPLRQLPQLGVQWANLTREVRVQEQVYDLLSAEYESARIKEAREVETVSVIDPAGWPEKKSFPPRLLLVALGTVGALAAAALLLLLVKGWRELDDESDGKRVARHILSSSEIVSRRFLRRQV